MGLDHGKSAHGRGLLSVLFDLFAQAITQRTN